MVTLLRLTFKPNANDMRAASGTAITSVRTDAGVIVCAYDPEGMKQARIPLPDLTYCHDPYEAAAEGDDSVVVYQWDAFQALNLKRLRSAMAGTGPVDLRNIYRREAAKAAGFAYTAVGR